MGNNAVRKFARQGLLREVERIDEMRAQGRILQALSAASILVAKVRQYLMAEEQEDGLEDACAFAAAEPPTDKMLVLPPHEGA